MNSSDEFAQTSLAIGNKKHGRGSKMIGEANYGRASVDFSRLLFSSLTPCPRRHPVKPDSFSGVSSFAWKKDVARRSWPPDVENGTTKATSHRDSFLPPRESLVSGRACQDVVGHNWSRSVSINQNHRRRGKKVAALGGWPFQEIVWRSDEILAETDARLIGN